MIIDAEYDEIDDGEDALDFTDADSLPWLEAEDEDEAAGGFDTSQFVGFLAVLAVLALLFWGIVYVGSNYDRGAVEIADGSLIEAPEGPYKERPLDPGGKEFAGTNDVAPGVGQGLTTDGRLADSRGVGSTGAGSGDGDLNVAMPPIGGGVSGVGGGSGSAANAGANNAGGIGGLTDASGASSTDQTPPAQVADTSGVGVQIGAFSSRARAEQGWTKLKGQSAALSKYDRRIMEGEADDAPVFRLQAVAPTLADANRLCRALRNEGLDCQVKR